VAESDFCTDFLMNSVSFSVNSAIFSEIGPSRSRQILVIFGKPDRIFKPWHSLILVRIRTGWPAPGAALEKGGHMNFVFREHLGTHTTEPAHDFQF
jgi:hypothetical protein